MRNMRLGVRRPFSHRVWIFARVLFDRSSDATIRVTLTQDRVHGAAEHLGIASLDLFLGVGASVFRIVRYGITMGLQFLDGCL